MSNNVRGADGRGVLATCPCWDARCKAAHVHGGSSSFVGWDQVWVQMLLDQLGWKMAKPSKGIYIWFIWLIDQLIVQLKPYAYMFQSQVYKQQSSCQVDEPWPVDLSMFTWTSQTPGPKIHPDLGTLGSWKWRMNGKYPGRLTAGTYKSPI